MTFHTMDSPEQPRRRGRHQMNCGRARLHLNARSLATVLSIDGEIDAANVDLNSSGPTNGAMR